MATEGPSNHPLDGGRFHENRSLYLEDWGTLVQPDVESADTMVGHSVNYGSTALQASYILNGGALAALPALLTSLTDAGREAIAWSAVPFILGITATAMSSLSAYLNFMWHAEVRRHDANRTAAMLKRFYQRTNDKDPDASQRQVLGRRITFTLYSGILAGVSALALFVIGSCQFILLALQTTK